MAIALGSDCLAGPVAPGRQTDQPNVDDVSSANDGQTNGCPRESFLNLFPKMGLPSLERLRDLATLTQPRLRVLVLLPRDGIHGIAGLTDSHDHAKLIARRGQVVVCLVTKGYLQHISSA